MLPVWAHSFVDARARANARTQARMHKRTHAHMHEHTCTLAHWGLNVIERALPTQGFSCVGRIGPDNTDRGLARLQHPTSVEQVGLRTATTIAAMFGRLRGRCQIVAHARVVDPHPTSTIPQHFV